MNKGFLLATGLLAGTIIGAGIFSLPYVFSRVGIATGIGYLVLFTLVYIAIHFMYAELVETRENGHQFFYFARVYLSPLWAKIASGVIFGELLFVLTVYLVLAPTFFKLVFGVSDIVGLLIFWFLGSVCMFVRLKWLGIVELAGIAGIIAIVVIVIGISGTSPLKTAFVMPINVITLLLPFGPLLFSLAARPAIPKVVEEHRVAKKAGAPFSLKKAVVWGTIIPAVVYLFFVVGMLRLNPNVSPESLNSLSAFPAGIVSLLGVMGLITLWTSYFMIGINVKDILNEDLKISKLLSIVITFFAPLILYFVGFKDFLSAISFTGSIFLGLEGIFVIMMWRKAFPKSNWRWVSAPLYAVFCIAIGYEIIKVVL